jgi:hypothetical protein
MVDKRPRAVSVNNVCQPRRGSTVCQPPHLGCLGYPFILWRPSSTMSPEAPWLSHTTCRHRSPPLVSSVGPVIPSIGSSPIPTRSCVCGSTPSNNTPRSSLRHQRYVSWSLDMTRQWGGHPLMNTARSSLQHQRHLGWHPPFTNTLGAVSVINAVSVVHFGNGSTMGVERWNVGLVALKKGLGRP